MSYDDARANFAENCNLVGPDPMADPQHWNLNHGLHELTSAIEADLQQIQHTLDAILRALNQR